MAKTIFDPQLSPLPEARDLWKQGERDQALTLFREAKKSQRHNLSAALDYARALGVSYQFHKSERVLAGLKPYCRDFPILNLLIGQVYRETRRPSEALKQFNKTLKLIPNSVDALVECASILERYGKTQRALDRVHVALSLEPSSPLLQLFEARLVSRTDRKLAIEKYSSILTNNGSLSPGLKSRAMHELAILIDASDPDKALHLITQAHALIKPGTSYMKNQGICAAERNVAFGKELTADMIRAADETIPTQERQKIIFLLGFARSGTTLLEKLLSLDEAFLDAEELDLYGMYIHPLLTGTLKSYARDDEESREVVRILRQRYLTCMQGYFGVSLDKHWLLDKNPSHTIICASLARTFPEGKFLVMLRDPRDTLLSAYFQYLPPNPESVAFLDWEMLVNRYAETMGAWIDLRAKLAPGVWREVRYEQLVTDPAKQINSIRDWLGVTAEAESLQVGSQHISSPSYAEVRMPAHAGRVGRWKHNTYKGLFDTNTQVTLRPLMEQLGYSW